MNVVRDEVKIWFERKLDGSLEATLLIFLKLFTDGNIISRRDRTKHFRITTTNILLNEEIFFD